MMEQSAFAFADREGKMEMKVMEQSAFAFTDGGAEPLLGPVVDCMV